MWKFELYYTNAKVFEKVLVLPFDTHGLYHFFYLRFWPINSQLTSFQKASRYFALTFL